jgi:hypothetical protein
MLTCGCIDQGIVLIGESNHLLMIVGHLAIVTYAYSAAELEKTVNLKKSKEELLFLFELHHEQPFP